MTEHHGLDLDAIAAASGGHSIFAPSASAMWLRCAGSLIPNITAPDDAGYDAAYGTVAHEVGELWLINCGLSHEGDIETLLDETAPVHLIGTIKVVQERREAFEILIDDEMLAYVREYVEWCVVLPGTHYIEQRVDFSAITPIPNQTGTADHIACEPKILTVTDLKMGKGEQVFAADDIDEPRAVIGDTLNGNPQALIYALGVFYWLDYLYHFEIIRIRIAQPRLGHFQTWETTREELLAFAEWAKGRAALAWVPNAPRTPSDKGCRWCKVRHTCAALVSFLDAAVDGVFDVAEDDVIEGQYRNITADEMARRKGDLMLSTYDPQPTPAGEMTTEHMAKLLPYRRLFERWFEEIEAELQFRASNGEQIPGFKLVNGRLGNRVWKDEAAAPEELEFIGVPEDKIYTRKVLSPAQAEEAIKAATGLKKANVAVLLSHLVTRSDGRPTLVSLSDKRDEIEDVGTAFDDVSDDI